MNHYSAKASITHVFKRERERERERERGKARKMNLFSYPYL